MVIPKVQVEVCDLCEKNPPVFVLPGSGLLVPDCFICADCWQSDVETELLRLQLLARTLPHDPFAWGLLQKHRRRMGLMSTCFAHQAWECARCPLDHGGL